MEWPEDLAALRREHRTRGIDLADLDPDPIAQLIAWRTDLHRHLPDDADIDAVVLATVDPDGGPSVRNVLLRGVDHDGLVFFTNYQSRKASAIEHEPRVALLFSWVLLGRQYIAQGRAARLGAAASDAYWATRPRGSQIGAWASPQSQAVAGRAELERRYAEVEAAHDGRDVPRPDHWGGYRVVPDVVEVWQGRDNRLHDRFRYARDAGQPSGWRIERLAP